MSAKSNKIAYFYDSEVGNFYYGQGHPMKPHRMRMTHALLMDYGLYKQMEVFKPTAISPDYMTLFHSDEYIDFLKMITPDNQHEHMRELKRFNVGEDCPVFDGVFQFCQIYTGGSVGGAVKLNHKDNDVVVNWMGGLHHAKKSEASGFCYVNDIVLAILELLKYHERVLYIDIDIHHGDGVEEAFYTTDRVMTVSFHKFGDYFPGTGHLDDIGQDKGKHNSLNIPLHDGIDDESYEQLFKPILSKVMEVYQPSAIVFQSGADSLSGDRLGCFNLSIKGHGECLKFMQGFNVPLLVLGGGGYTIRNVSRCWAYETGLLLDQPLDDKMPTNPYYEYYGPDFRLHIQPSNMENQNSKEYLDKVRCKMLENLRHLDPVPSVQMHETAPDAVLPEEEEEEDPDERPRVKGAHPDLSTDSDDEFEIEEKAPRHRGMAEPTSAEKPTATAPEEVADAFEATATEGPAADAPLAAEAAEAPGAPQAVTAPPEVSMDTHASVPTYTAPALSDESASLPEETLAAAPAAPEVAAWPDPAVAALPAVESPMAEVADMPGPYRTAPDVPMMVAVHKPDPPMSSEDPAMVGEAAPPESEPQPPALAAAEPMEAEHAPIPKVPEPEASFPMEMNTPMDLETEPEGEAPEEDGEVEVPPPPQAENPQAPPEPFQGAGFAPSLTAEVAREPEALPVERVHMPEAAPPPPPPPEDAPPSVDPAWPTGADFDTP
ncbi:hypothetical protein CYMTET_48582 [Cymbomonas tetramitiformis]|uniref:histone deacetylase n=1 Tax=Cymbomonas tetramitiformis TaxID=36881 RepID=A0AAE0BTU7_9CHLO|nr:hypothetical protein CYMTET_48582 [Cymbomonas tetramitiformis]